MALGSGTGTARGFSAFRIALHPRGGTLGESSHPDAADATRIPFSVAPQGPHAIPGIASRPGPPSDLKQPPCAGTRGHGVKVQGRWVLSLQHSQAPALPFLPLLGHCLGLRAHPSQSESSPKASAHRPPAFPQLWDAPDSPRFHLIQTEDAAEPCTRTHVHSLTNSCC